MGIELVKPGGSLSFEKTKVRAVEEVYVGDSAPTEDKGYKVWVNPDGDEVAEIAELATKKYVDDAVSSVDLSSYATKQYVDSAIDNVDLSGYATKQYVDSAVSNIEIPEVDLSGYALKSEIPDTSAFRTEEEIIALIEAHGGDSVDLTGYATETYVDDAIKKIELTPGAPGKDGEPGKDGYTPVKGVDYYTEAEKAALVQDVLAALPAAESVGV